MEGHKIITWPNIVRHGQWVVVIGYSRFYVVKEIPYENNNASNIKSVLNDALAWHLYFRNPITSRFYVLQNTLVQLFSYQMMCMANFILHARYHWLPVDKIDVLFVVTSPIKTLCLHA